MAATAIIAAGISLGEGDAVLRLSHDTWTEGSSSSNDVDTEQVTQNETSNTARRRKTTSFADGGEILIKTKSFTLEEVALHKGPTSYWTAVGDSVYDVSSFVLSGRHPGGDLIYQGVGRDATVLFKTSHPARVSSVLAKYYIGELRRPSEDTSVRYKWDSEFYTVLQKRVEAYFADNKIPKQGSPTLWLQAFQTVFFFILFLYVGYIQGSLLGCVMMGWFYSQFGIMIMHDGTHGGFSKNPTISMLASLVMDLMGSSSLVWKHEHNIGHHQYTNTTEDPDATTAFPIVRYHPSQPWRHYHRYQPLYVWLVYPFIVYKWYLSDIIFVIKGQYRNIPMYNPPVWYLVLFAVTKAFLPLWVIWMPCHLHGTAHGLLCMAVTFCTASYAFALQFVVTHLADDVTFPEEEIEKKKKENEEEKEKKVNDWAECQVTGSSNYSTSNPLAAWLSGGLNFQIEHHLFPAIAHTRLSEIAPIVKRTCTEFGVPYKEHESFWSAVYHHHQHLCRMAVRPNHPTKEVFRPKTAKYDILLILCCAVFMGGSAIVAHIYSSN